MYQDKEHPENCNSTTFNLIKIGPTNKLQTSISPLYSDYNLKCFIGENTSNVIIYNGNKPDVNNLYYTSVTTVYRLPKGNIGISHAPMLQNFGNFYGLPVDEIEIAPIVFGSGDYLHLWTFKTPIIYIYINLFIHIIYYKLINVKRF